MSTLRPKPTPAVLLEAARRELGDDILRGEGGRIALERYSARLDALIAQLVADAPPAGRRVTVAALGGYGRRHLCLYSDIDLLIVFDGALEEADEQFRGEEVPLPAWWGGYRLLPDAFEVWQNRPNRLHDRARYERAGDGWSRTRLGP